MHQRLRRWSVNSSTFFMAVRAPPAAYSIGCNISVTQEFRTSPDNISSGQAAGPLQRAFPYRKDTPAFGLKPRQGGIIACAVPRDLVFPEFLPRCRPFEQMAVVSVPEAAV